MRTQYTFLLSFSLAVISLSLTDIRAQSVFPADFTNESQVGSPALEGSFHYHSEGQKYRLKGSGENIWFDHDQFYFLWRKVKGDFSLQSRIGFIGEGQHAHRKIGIMLRKDLSPGSSHYSATVHGDGLTSLQYREIPGGEMNELKADSVIPYEIRLERKNDRVEFSFAGKGSEWKTVYLENLSMEGEYYIGIFICSHDPEHYEEAVFDNLRFTVPAPAGLVPYEDYLGSRIEILNMETGTCETVHTSPLSLQAPNWTKDGRSLIYNSEGKIFSLDIATRNVIEIPTGFAIRNNNDHVLSFDGKWMGISHHAEEDEGNSIIYIIPSEGGIPERITPKGPSYLHGWSPDGKYLTYTGGREGNYDIYKISTVDKKEIRLTTATELDDGSEFSPDGNYIYFNSSRTGTMQIWRMKADGSSQEQLSFDKYNDWFPHLSPDGSTIVFLSYMPEIQADDHPFYKNVYLRKMNSSGGEPEVIARLYGGQGTINVHSWSPDGKKIAFVTNSADLR